MTNSVIERAKELLGAVGVSEGPWRVDLDAADHLAYDRPIYDAKDHPLAICPDCGTRGGFVVGDAELIAATRTLIPELVAEIERLQALVPRT